MLRRKRNGLTKSHAFDFSHREGFEVKSRDRFLPQSVGAQGGNESSTRADQDAPPRKQLVKGKRGYTAFTAKQDSIATWSGTGSKTGEVAVSMSNLRNKCAMLVNYSHLDISELEKRHPEVYKEVIHIIQLGKSLVGKPEYKEYMDIIGEIFASNEAPSERGTIGDLMYGCYREPSMSGRLGCTPECAGSLLRHDTKESDICNHHVAIYKSKLVLSYVPTSPSEQLHIHAYKKKITLHHDEDLKSLADRGIQHFRVHWHLQDTEDAQKKDGPVYSIKKLQSSIGKGGHVCCYSDGSETFHRDDSASSKRSSKQGYEQEEDTGYYYWALWLIFIFIFLIIAVFVCWYCCYKGETVPAATAGINSHGTSGDSAGKTSTTPTAGDTMPNRHARC